jgi:hypothetical protein
MNFVVRRLYGASKVEREGRNTKGKLILGAKEKRK